MRLFLHLIALPALTAFVLSSCAAMKMRNFIEPEISIAGFETQSVGLLETAVDYEIRIVNQNRFPIYVDGGIHDITLNGARVGKGLNREKITIEPLATTISHVVVRFNHIEMALNPNSLFGAPTGGYNYQIDSRIWVALSPNAKPRELETSQTGHFNPARGFTQ